MKSHLLLFACLLSTTVIAKNTKKSVLFIGNSYTYTNDLPKMIADAAKSAGDTLIFDSNAPGGWSFTEHASNPTTQSKIALGNWDFMVLQDQSQKPSFPIAQVEKDVFPYAKQLDSSFNKFNSCGETIFYVTWGRKNGDAANCGFYAPLCTYQGMDSLLQLRYKMMADSNKAILSPVAAVWRKIRTSLPGIELYSPDESHPSIAGTYAAACCFYVSIFRKDPNAITFNSSLSPTDAAAIRAVAKAVVFDSLKKWNIGLYDTKANFNSVVSANKVNFTNSSTNGIDYTWDFGDGNQSTIANPSHTYTAKGSYTVRLIAKKCGISDTISKTIVINSLEIQTAQISKNNTLYPNPCRETLYFSQKFNESFDYKIITTIGQVVLSGQIKAEENSIKIDELPAGNYFIQLQNTLNQQAQFHFIKE